MGLENVIGNKELVYLFGKTMCHGCHEAKEYLMQKGVNFQYINVDDINLFNQFKTFTEETSVPVLIDSQRRYKIVGYSPRMYKDLVK